MRVVYMLILVIVLVAVVVFAVQNNEAVTLRYLDRSVSTTWNRVAVVTCGRVGFSDLSAPNNTHDYESEQPGAEPFLPFFCPEISPRCRERSQPDKLVGRELFQEPVRPFPIEPFERVRALDAVVVGARWSYVHGRAFRPDCVEQFRSVSLLFEQW
jgi:hypothetical protein